MIHIGVYHTPPTSSIESAFRCSTLALFPQMAGELTLALDDGAHAGHFEDVLGQTFHDLGVENKWKGQFFTPINLSDLMAELSFDEKNGFAKVYEPACGAGSTILGFANAHMMKHPEQPFDDFCVFAGEHRAAQGLHDLGRDGFASEGLRLPRLRLRQQDT